MMGMAKPIANALRIIRQPQELVSPQNGNVSHCSDKENHEREDHVKRNNRKRI
jgi:hypothetical protein